MIWRSVFAYEADVRPVSRRLSICFGVLLVLLVACSSAYAASAQVTPASAVFPQRALVVSGSGLGALNASRVHIVENGSPVRAVTVRSLTKPSARDFGVVLVIDVSPTKRAIERAVAAARVLASRRPPEESFGIVEADASPAVTLGLTTDANAISNALSAVPKISHHGLQVYDAALSGIGLLHQEHIAAGSVIVLSDGADSGHEDILRQVATLAGSAHVKIFAVGINSPRFHPLTLADLAGVSGGQFVKSGASHLSDVFGAIQTRLSRQYIIRYYSAQRAGEQIPASLHIDGVPGAFNISYATPRVFAGALKPKTRPSFWTSTLGAILTSVVCAILLALSVLLLISRRRGLRARVGEFVPSAVSEVGKHRTLVQRALGDQRLRRPERLRWVDALLLEYDVARIRITPERLALLTFAGTILLAGLLVAATSSPAGVIVALAVPVAVRFGIHHAARRQRRQFEEQLPENLQVIASALRAGHTFVGALGVMADDAPEPSRREFRQALADEALGVPLADTLEQVSLRMDSLDFQQVTLVATLQRDTGGNTAEVIDLVAETIRDRIDLRRLVRSLTAQGRLAGGILSGLPVLLLVAISIINPSYTHPLFHDTAGIVALILAAGMVVSGSFLIRRIVDIQV